jgi:hypothetical protein
VSLSWNLDLGLQSSMAVFGSIKENSEVLKLYNIHILHANYDTTNARHTGGHMSIDEEEETARIQDFSRFRMSVLGRHTSIPHS